MAEADSMTQVIVKDGKLVSECVIDKEFPKIEKGALAAVNAIVVHQTDSSTANSVFNSYKGGKAGAHFLIDKDGTIYQTARIDRMCWHVGLVKSRCYALKSCTEDELKKINSILYKKGDAYSLRVRALHDYEEGKGYPDRYPTNSDSLGIELVGAYLSKTKSYEEVTEEQNKSLVWLLSVLEDALRLSTSDVYRHPDVSYKQASEASTAKLQ